ncbi:uncharacterized protein LOC103519395, partial [Diaphorina citri]|uniref:Uncharacterized protein LOC103519395 n=1 Tax=Diaphorina citri TaxID=121845 RepID=A0A3Q0JE77_DIACI
MHQLTQNPYASTVFPHFNLTVQARKGTAILWYNTHTSGEMDNRMVHSACPVLLGHKWSLNLSAIISSMYISYCIYTNLYFPFGSTGDEIIVFFQQLYSNKFNVINHLSENQFVYPVMDAMEYISYYHPSERKYQVAVHHFYKLVQFLANEVSPYVLISFVSQVKSMYPDEPIIEEIHSLAVTRLEEVYYQNHTRAQVMEQILVLCKTNLSGAVVSTVDFESRGWWFESKLSNK